MVLDSEGLAYINPDMFHDRFAQDVNLTEADVMAVAPKPFNGSIFGEKSDPPAWKNLPTWYQVSESDLMIPLDVWSVTSPLGIGFANLNSEFFS